MKSNNNELYELEFGHTKAHVSYPEARCLWEILPRRKFSGIKAVSSYKQESAKQFLDSLLKKFNCTLPLLVDYALEAHFYQGYYQIERNHKKTSNEEFLVHAKGSFKWV